MSAAVIALARDRLFALVNEYTLDGRAGSHPVHVRGVTTMNCYLLVEDDRALLYSTGYSVHQEALLAQLAGLVGGRELSLVIPRVEFLSMCNARPIADRFGVSACYQRLPVRPSALLNFRPEFADRADDGLQDVELCLIRRQGATVAVDGRGARRLEFLLPELRLLPCSWAFDHGTGTLFTGDVFSWTWRDAPGGPWVADGGDDDVTPSEQVEDFLVNNRYWWLAGADTAPLRRAVAQVFERFDVRIVAPDHGCVLHGAAIERHHRLLDGCLAALAARASEAP